MTRQRRTSLLLFLLALFLAKLADQVLLFLVPLVVFQTTRDVGLSGLAFSVEAFPRFLSFPVCGVLCDRVSPVALLRANQLLRAVVCVGGVAHIAVPLAWMGLAAFLLILLGAC